MVKILFFIFISSNLIYHVIILVLEFHNLMSIILRNQSAKFLMCFLIGMICFLIGMMCIVEIFRLEVFYDNVICFFYKLFESKSFVI
jgi:hypothetical protein